MKEGAIENRDKMKRKYILFILGCIFCWVTVAKGDMRTVLDPDNFYRLQDNLLVNGGFETGENDLPTGWKVSTTTSSQLKFIWDTKRKNGGKYSASIWCQGSYSGAWSQDVLINPGEVYMIKGHVAFANLSPLSKCKINLLFKDEKGLPVKQIDLPFHSNGSRNFAEDFPGGLKFRVPDDSMSLTVRCILQGPGKAWFDDLYLAKTPTGSFTGRVRSGGKPLTGAIVEILYPVWGKRYSILTDSNGKYRLDGVPLASSRYAVKAYKEGYINQSHGNLGITPGSETSVNFDLQQGTNPALLQIVFGSVSSSKEQEFSKVPKGARIPSEKNGYPSFILPFLQSDQFSELQNPEIQTVVHEILSGVALDQRNDTRTVALAVYDWVNRNIEHVSVFEDPAGRGPIMREKTQKDTLPASATYTSTRGHDSFAEILENNMKKRPLLDVTSLKTWGGNWYDWVLRPHELLRYKTGICIERALLLTGLLRALNIPARAAVEKLEFWAQTDAGNGTWVGLDPTRGRNEYRKNGKLGVGFESPRLAFYSINSRPLLQMDLDAAKGVIWYELHPYELEYDFSDAGLSQAMNALQEMSKTGLAPPPQKKKRNRSAKYITTFRILTIDPSDLIGQEFLTVKFPIVADSQLYSNTGEYGYQVNFPNSVVSTSLETIKSEKKGRYEQWVSIRIMLSKIPKRANPSHEIPPPINRNKKNPGISQGNFEEKSRLSDESGNNRFPHASRGNLQSGDANRMKGVGPNRARLQAKPKGDFIEDFDRDGDGKVSEEEFSGRFFMRLDRNRDGYIDATEAPVPKNPIP